MSDIKFSCPNCDKHLVADESIAGNEVVCPDCGEKFIVMARGDTVRKEDPKLNGLELVRSIDSLEKKVKIIKKSNRIIACRDCGGMVSKSAETCPHCGAPSFGRIHKIPYSQTQSNPPVQTIEKTGKRYKGLMIFSAIFIGVGIACLLTGEFLGTGLVLLILGPILFIYARVMAWWHHG